ncbi:MAG: hypothetical protein JWO85_400 [Candidatus Eremiobacteraeota bacterium]|jgi:hypothetical protein|nr:hypothetical protein [Candidatus Eremiobacteraeota bacterium]
MKRTADTINYVNIGLTLVSCVAAYVFPFELFLLSYAVLGPLHYLTEISWLHDRRYFVQPGPEKRAWQAQRFWLGLVLVTLAVMLYGLAAEKILKQTFSPALEIGLFYGVFVSASLLVFLKNKAMSAALISLTALALVVFSGSRYFGLIAFLLITIVHVFVFTAAFVLFGALKSKSRSGTLSLAVFLLCAVSFFVYVPAALGSTVGDYVRHSYGSFQTLNAELIKLFHLGTGASLSEIYESTAGLTVMRLIAFAYTYHYLNWFSKTSIIKWHEVSKSRAALIVGVWLSSVAVYAYSYDVGMIALYFLSVLHVMLEFPLNHQTFAGIAKEAYALARGAPKPVSSA